MAAESYYDLLGVAKTASPDEVKKAFRGKAHQLHPDKGGDAEAFKKVNEAYQTLSDPKKKAEYDRFGAAGPQPQGRQGGGEYGGFGFDFGGGGGGFGDIFADMFGAALANVQAEVQISLPQAVLGDTVELRVGKEKVRLVVPAGCPDGHQVVIRGMGKQHRTGKGDLVLILRVAIPRRLSRRERELYEELKKLG